MTSKYQDSSVACVHHYVMVQGGMTCQKCGHVMGTPEPRPESPAASTYDHPATATAAREEVVRVEEWTTESVPVEAYDRLLDFTKRCERLLTEIRDGKHSLPGTLVQIDRLLEEGHPEFRRPA